jgi:putative ABC transport system substrate-binding protein
VRVVSHNSSPISPIVCAAVLAALFACCHSAQAQQKSHLPRIGYLTVASLSANKTRVEAFRQGLRDLGYQEGQNIIVEWRSGAGKAKREDELVAEALRLDVDVIISSGPTMTRAAKQATSIIPIVMAFDSDPIGNGFVASLARPGGNITGLSALSPELAGKQVELLKEVLPRIARIAILGNSDEPANQNTVNEIGTAARAMSVQVQSMDVRGAEDVKTAVAGAIKSHADAAIVVPSLVFTDKRAQLANLVLQARLPSVYFRHEFVEAGGLMSYAPSFTDLSRRAASYVDKILKGAKPADLPVEQPTKFELVINLKTAKEIGLTIPPNVLARADRVIK